ncbi:MAG: 2-oxoacid:acceptor oxidoreductase family protein [Myxococcota bacterium]|jgi:2-oxoglutarate ferredoxin oxidoreductase subunit gamma|nr:2-oxoacid:acceptor oxidoreductase family protein [Myxococcota bacterium]
MLTEVLFAGFGGQGIMLIGQMLAYAGMNEGKQVCWLPSYGPEMRGGTAYCSVVVSDRPIGSPVVRNPQHVAVLNLPSLQKFGPRVKVGGLLLINSSLIDTTADRDDIDQLLVPANALALAAGNGKAANMAILGAYLGRTGTVEIPTVEALIRKQFAKKPELAELNLEVLRRGIALGQPPVAAPEAPATTGATPPAPGGGAQ